MKKIALTLATFALVFVSINLFTTCKKKDGVYKPKEKISKIYYEVVRYDSAGKVDTAGAMKKELKEIWRWDKKKLMQIESYDRSWSWDFVYKGDQVTKIESGDMTVNFTYKDKSDLEKIEVLDDQERTLLIVTVKDRSDRKITKLSYAIYTYEKSLKSGTLLSDRLEPVMHIMLGNNVGETVLSNMASNEKMHKANTIVNVSADLTYSGNNVTKAQWTTENNPIPLVYTYTYDNKVNPYYRAIALMFSGDVYGITTQAFFNLFPCSENNMIGYEEVQDTNRTSIKYVYEYDSKDFPVKQTKVYEYIHSVYGKYTYNYIYHYEYVD
ncbi:MAG: hypothetical protein LBL13_03890 [Bacteroidales bacterium]|jgi:hypothetical protein|nr:hypothetical protein [Bacteroidales bacterium]